MSSEETRTPDQRLRSIAGRWRTSGHVIGEPAIPVVGTDIYEVFPGGYFLVHHVDVTVGDQPVRAIEIIGEPDGSGGYLARSFESEGEAEVMHLTIDDDGVFHLHGRQRYRANRTAHEHANRARPIHAQNRARPPIDERTLGAIRGRHHLASVDGHGLSAE